MLVFSLLAGVVLLHAAAAAWLTFAGPRERLWGRLALMSTLVTMVMALVLLIVAFVTRGISGGGLELGVVWTGALVLEGLCVFAVRRASPRLAATSVALVLFAVPMTWVVREAAAFHHRSTHWHCLVREVRNSDGTYSMVMPDDE